MTELQKRVLTALVGGSLFIGVLLFGGWIGMLFLVLILSLAMLWELGILIYRLKDTLEKRYVLMLLGWLFLILNFFSPQLEFFTLLGVFCVLFAYFLITAKDHPSPEGIRAHFQEGLYSLFSLIYVCALPLLLLRLYEGVDGQKWVLLLFCMIWTGDSAAYFVGKHYGKNLLAPGLSPKKTWEGSLGGLLGTLTAVLLFYFFFFRHQSFWSLFLLGILTSLTAQGGDLCESFLKRALSVKDSGNLLPGHGGFLDRFDSVIFSLPWIYGWVRLFT